jgi:undecaprenyl diphosphate synthase
MDGNGRWAKKKGLPRTAGHSEGAKSLRAVIEACQEFGVYQLTVYAFSTENWGRPEDEVGFLMGLFSRTIDKEVADLIKNEISIKFLGRLSKFSPELQKKMKESMEKTKHLKRGRLNVMVNYGARAEIVDAVNEILKERDGGRGTRDEVAEEVTEEEFSRHLYTRDVPDPDLLIRTASEFRVSNFLLWQIAYSEIYVTEALWPDFRRDQLAAAIEDYQKRERRYGKLK